MTEEARKEALNGVHRSIMLTAKNWANIEMVYLHNKEKLDYEISETRFLVSMADSRVNIGRSQYFYIENNVWGFEGDVEQSLIKAIQLNKAGAFDDDTWRRVRGGLFVASVSYAPTFGTLKGEAEAGIEPMTHAEAASLFPPYEEIKELLFS